MEITWVTRSFLDYRIPVYEELNRLCGGKLNVIYYADVVPQRCQEKLWDVLKTQSIALSGEIRIGGKKIENQSYANAAGFRIPIRPGLLNIIRVTEPEVILSDGFFQWTYAALLANLIWQIPHVMCYERTLHTERSVSRIRTLFRKMALKYIDAICCNGTLSKEYLMNLGVPEEQLFIGNMAADYRGLQSSISDIRLPDINRLKKRIEAKGMIFLYVGQLIPRKGILELLRAWEVFSTDLKQEATLILLGGGNQENEVKEHISSHKLINVFAPGLVDYTEVAKYYAVADVFVIATLEDNWSLVVPEAMSVGLPIICSKYNGCWPELVRPENGWVFDPLDHNNFVFTLKEAWEKRNNWEKMGKKSQEIVQDYTPEKVAQNIYSACLKVTASNSDKDE